MGKKIKETRATCQSCGEIWHYGKGEAMQSCGGQMQNAGKSMTCLCCLPDTKTVDYNKCPKCSSKAVTKEQVIHEI